MGYGMEPTRSSPHIPPGTLYRLFQKSQNTSASLFFSETAMFLGFLKHMSENWDKLIHVWSNSQSIWFSPTEELLQPKLQLIVKAGYDKKVSEPTVHCSLLCMVRHSHRPLKVPILSPVHCRKHLQHIGIRTEPWRNGRRWHSLINHVFFYIM